MIEITSPPPQFDTRLVEKVVGDVSAQVLYRMAAYARTTAQRSMRYVTRPKRGSKRVRIVSQPGEPPRAVKPHPWLRKHLAFAVDTERGSYVVGPKALRGSRAFTPGLLERGGSARVTNTRRLVRKLGGYGEIRVKLPAPKNPVKGRDVWYTTLKTQAQVRRANELNEYLYGPEIISINMAPRPYMVPAMMETAANFKEIWNVEPAPGEA
jgi:hypothetical protein